MRSWMRRDSAWRLAVAGTAVLLALAFYRDFVFHPGRMLFGTDMVDQAYQLRRFGVEEIRTRGFPLWNPFVYGGLPYLAILPGPVFYPTSLLYLVLPLYRAIGWTFVLHTALAGIFGTFAARSLRLDRWPSAIAGLAFMFSGFVVSTLYGGHDGRMFGMVLIPLAFGCLERGLASERPGWFVGFGLTVALQIFTPHVQVMYYSSLLLLLYAVLRIGEGLREVGGGRRAARLGGLTLAGFALAGLVGAAQLLPTLGILDIAVRGSGAGESGYAFASSWALPWQEITALGLPDLLGSLATYWGRNPFKLHTEYVGAVPLALGAVALAGVRSDRRVRRLVVCLAVAILFSLGASTPVHRIAYALIPFVGRFRAASMMMGPAALMFALLAGLGWQRVLDARAGGRELPWAWLWVASAPVLLIALGAVLSPDGLLRWILHGWMPAGWSRMPPPELAPALRVGGWILLVGWSATLGLGRTVARGRAPGWSAAVVMLFLVAELWRVDARYLSTVRPEEVFPDDPVIEAMRAELGPGERVFPFPIEESYRPNELTAYDIPVVTGSQNFRLAWFDRLVGGASPGGYRNMGRPALWGLLDVRFLTTRSPVQHPALETVAEGSRARAHRVVRNTPHAFFPDSVIAVRDEDEALRRVLAFQDPTSLAVVQADRAPSAGAGSASIRIYEPNRLELTVEAERGGLLFVSEIDHPSWRATVDGVETPILRTDVAFRGVVIPAGRHTLRFTYSSREFRAGFLLSGAGLIIAVGGLVGIGVARRRKGTASGPDPGGRA
ncbi:MAG: hypothetical protein ACE5HF_04475 [Gemmatimonadota bacterium]